MPPKQKQYEDNKPTIATLRQQLRNKLIQIGIKLDHKQEDRKKSQKPKKQETKTGEDENLPVLHSFRTNKALLQQFKSFLGMDQIRLRNLKKEQSQISKEGIKGMKYSYSINTERNKSPNNLKFAIRKRMAEERKEDRSNEKLPSVNRQLSLKFIVNEWQSTIKNIRNTEPLKPNKEVTKNNVNNSSRRAKTEQKQKPLLQLKRKPKKTFSKQVGPWEREQAARQTNYLFG